MTGGEFTDQLNDCQLFKNYATLVTELRLWYTGAETKALVRELRDEVCLQRSSSLCTSHSGVSDVPLSTLDRHRNWQTYKLRQITDMISTVACKIEMSLMYVREWTHNSNHSSTRRWIGVMNFTPRPLYHLRKQFPVSAQQEAAATFIKCFYSYFALVSEKHGKFQTLHPGLSSNFTSPTSHPFNFLVTVTASPVLCTYL